MREQLIDTETHHHGTWGRISPSPVDERCSTDRPRTCQRFKDFYRRPAPRCPVNVRVPPFYLQREWCKGVMRYSYLMHAFFQR